MSLTISNEDEEEIADKIAKCGHEIVQLIGYQDNYYDEPIPMGQCVNCQTSRMLGSHYEPLYKHNDVEYYMLRVITEQATEGLARIVEEDKKRNEQ